MSSCFLKADHLLVVEAVLGAEFPKFLEAHLREVVDGKPRAVLRSLACAGRPPDAWAWPVCLGLSVIAFRAALVEARIPAPDPRSIFRPERHGLLVSGIGSWWPPFWGFCGGGSLGSKSGRAGVFRLTRILSRSPCLRLPRSAFPPLGCESSGRRSARRWIQAIRRLASSSE